MSSGRRVSGLASLLVVVLATTLIARPDARTAVEEQFPRGLLQAATPKRGCTIETRSLSFGEYDTTARNPLDERGEVIYNCSSDNPNNPVGDMRIEISRGLSGSYDRAMISVGDRLSYNLYLDATHRTVWGDGSSGTDYYFDRNPPDRRSVSVNVYGRIPEGQDVGTGQYFDVLVVRVLF
jgi:spore coat protein U-like protein